MTAWRRLRAWQGAGGWERLHEQLLAELHAADEIEWERAIAEESHIRPKRGSKTGPSPVDSGRAGSKHHLLVDGSGLPLAWTLTGGNRNDVTQLIELVPACTLSRRDRNPVLALVLSAVRPCVSANGR